MPKKKRVIKRSGKFYVYILRCGDNTLYTGYTPDLKKRVKTHQAGKGAKYTRTRLPVRLAWFKEYKYFKLAFMEEIRIKKIPRARKEKLIREFRKKQRRKKNAAGRQIGVNNGAGKRKRKFGYESKQ